MLVRDPRLRVLLHPQVLKALAGDLLQYLEPMKAQIESIPEDPTPLERLKVRNGLR